MPQKMQWKKVPPEMITRFEQIVPKDDLVETRKMFGCPCAFITGKMKKGR
jgi:hypothetical protein